MMREWNSDNKAVSVVQGPLLLRRCLLVSLLLSSFLLGCGKYSPPLAPEDLSPQPVVSLKVASSPEGVAFAWEAPAKDQRGNNLRSLDGYRIYRKELAKNSDLLDADVEYQLISTIEDKHLSELARLKDEARASGKPTRSVKVAPELKAFTFTDSAVESGKRYAYQITPVNQGSEEGDPGQIIIVRFRGESSEVSMVPLSQAKDDVF
jgi:hypothetical protein